MKTTVTLTILTTTLLTSPCLSQEFETLPRKSKTAKQKPAQKKAQSQPKTIIIDGTLYELRPIGKSPKSSAANPFWLDPARSKRDTFKEYIPKAQFKEANPEWSFRAKPKPFTKPKFDSFGFAKRKGKAKGKQADSYFGTAKPEYKSNLEFKFKADAKPKFDYFVQTPKSGFTLKQPKRTFTLKAPKTSFEYADRDPAEKPDANSFKLIPKRSAKAKAKPKTERRTLGFGTARASRTAPMSNRVEALSTEIRELKRLLDRLESRLDQRQSEKRRKLR